MMKGSHGQRNQLYDINWGALDHASHVPQLLSCNYYAHHRCSLSTTCGNLYLHVQALLKPLHCTLDVRHACRQAGMLVKDCLSVCIYTSLQHVSVCVSRCLQKNNIVCPYLCVTYCMSCVCVCLSMCVCVYHNYCHIEKEHTTFPRAKIQACSGMYITKLRSCIPCVYQIHTAVGYTTES